MNKSRASKQPKHYILLATILSLAGCTSARQTQYWSKAGYYGVNQPYQVQDQRIIFNRDLHVLEFKDNGEIWNSDQTQGVINRVTTAKRTPLVVLFAHGWNNNADYFNGNLKGFHELLDHITKQSAFSQNEVIGVYIGWNGGPPDLRTIDPKSIWQKFTLGNRLQAADTIGSSSSDNSLHATVTAIAAATNLNGGQLLLIGHSLGGRMLERMVHAHPKATHPGALIVVVNPAAPGDRAISIRKEVASHEKPTIIGIAARTDMPVRFLMPTMEILFNQHAPPEDSNRRNKAAAYMVESVTHYFDDSKVFLDSLEMTKSNLIQAYAERRTRGQSLERQRDRLQRLRAAEIAINSVVESSQQLRLAIDDAEHVEASRKSRKELADAMSTQKRGSHLLSLTGSTAGVRVDFFPMPDQGRGDDGVANVAVLASAKGHEGITDHVYPVISAAPIFFDGHSGSIFSPTLAALLAELFSMKFAN